MKPTGIDDPEPHDAVMQGMEPPEEYRFMRNAVGPVETEFGNRHRKRDLDNHWQMGRPQVEPHRRQRLQNIRGYHREDRRGGGSELYEPLRQKRVTDAVDGLTIPLKPFDFIGNIALEEKQAENRARINGEKGCDRMTARKSEIGPDEAADEHQWPGGIGKGCF
ncbi:hypothetical protein D3C86_1335560 [compost metagenome]